MRSFWNKIKSLFKKQKMVLATENDASLAVDNTAKKHKHKYVRLCDRTLENDIKYRGPLSYRYMRLIGWIFEICFVCGAIMTTKFFSEKLTTGGAVVAVVFSYVGELAVPAFLIANFALILSTNMKSFKLQFKKYLIFLGIIWLLLFGFLYRFIFTIVNSTNHDFFKSCEELTSLLNSTPKLGFALNMFIDLILCLCVWFFLTYRPKKLNAKQTLAFRFLAIIPILYELAAIIIKLLPLSYKEFKIPFFLFPLMSSKPPFTFIAFLIIAFYLKFREKRFLKRHNGSYEAFDEHLKTNANSLSFSLFTSLVFLIVGLIDILTLTILTRQYAVAFPELPLAQIIQNLAKRGIGVSSSLIIFIPIILLFSYTKKHKPGVFDTILPIAGIVLVALAILETIIDILFKV